jgi:hypothetical protein
MQILDLLKLLQELGKRRMKKNCSGGEFMYDIFDILYDPV